MLFELRPSFKCMSEHDVASVVERATNYGTRHPANATGMPNRRLPFQKATPFVVAMVNRRGVAPKAIQNSAAWWPDRTRSAHISGLLEPRNRVLDGSAVGARRVSKIPPRFRVAEKHVMARHA